MYSFKCLLVYYISIHLCFVAIAGRFPYIVAGSFPFCLWHAFLSVICMIQPHTHIITLLLLCLFAKVVERFPNTIHRSSSNTCHTNRVHSCGVGWSEEPWRTLQGSKSFFASVSEVMPTSPTERNASKWLGSTRPHTTQAASKIFLGNSNQALVVISTIRRIGATLKATCGGPTSTLAGGRGHVSFVLLNVERDLLTSKIISFHQLLCLNTWVVKTSNSCNWKCKGAVKKYMEHNLFPKMM